MAKAGILTPVAELAAFVERLAPLWIPLSDMMLLLVVHDGGKWRHGFGRVFIELWRCGFIEVRGRLAQSGGWGGLDIVTPVHFQFDVRFSAGVLLDVVTGWKYAGCEAQRRVIEAVSQETPGWQPRLPKPEGRYGQADNLLALEVLTKHPDENRRVRFPIQRADLAAYQSRCPGWATDWTRLEANLARMLGRGGFDAKQRRMRDAMRDVLKANTAD